MPEVDMANQAAQAANGGHGAVWNFAAAVLGAATTLGIAKIKSKPVNRQILEALRDLKDVQLAQGKELTEVKTHMATRDELSQLHGKIDRHVEAHAAQSFKGAA